ncbi:MAG: dihydroorotase [Pseudomonadota bacterium]
MSKTLIRNARILDPASDTDDIGDLLIDGGKIEAVGTNFQAANSTDILDADGLCVAPGLIDLHVKTGEPGEEHRETLSTASRAAVAGGITSMAIMPNANHVIDDVARVEFIARRGALEGKNRIYPVGALTRGLEGDAMAELGLMQEAGALYCSNGETSLADAGTMKRILSYAKDHNVTVSVRPNDPALSGSGVMNAGPLAAKMGLSGIPNEAELIPAQRDTWLANSIGARLLFDQVSTPQVLAHLSQSRERGSELDVHCTVAAHTLFFDEEEIGDYRTHCKVSPPFQTRSERDFLRQCAEKGQISAVVSGHDPQPAEEKRLPFQEASFGAVGLETLLPAMVTMATDGAFSLLQAIRLVTSGPADLFDLPQGRLMAGAPADIVLFDAQKTWKCRSDDLISRSTNSPFDGHDLKGKVIKTMVAGQWVFEAN